MSRTYLYVVLLFSPVFMLNNVLLCFVRNDGAPQLSMAAMLTGSFSNVLLDYIFIFPLQMGIFGAVFATGLAPLISMMVLSPYFLKKKHAFHLIPCSFSLSHLKMIFFSGLPSLVTEASSGIVIIVFNAIILGIQGNIGIAAYGVVANLSLVVLSIYTGIAQGIQPIISSHYGAGNYSKIQAIFRYAMITLFLLSGLIYGGIFLWAPEIASIFNSEQLVTLSQIAVGGLRIYFTACLFVGFNIILSVYFTSTDRPFPAHILSLLRGFFIIIPLAFLFSRLAGMTGVWLTFPVTELTVAIVGFLFYRRASLPPS